MTDKLNLNDIEVVWDYWYPRVYSYFYKRIDKKDLIEDLTAETMNTVFLCKNEIQNLPAYMWKVAHNYLVKYIKTKSTSPMTVAFDDDLDSYEPISVELEITTERPGFDQRKQDLIECINHSNISEIEREIMLGSIIKDLNSTDLSRLLNIKPDTIRQKLKRTLEKVRSQCLYLYN
jgi:RNA polymerase sigma factor (sigma-70 family)